MSRGLCAILLVAALLVFSGCSSHVPVWRLKAQQTMIQLERDGVAQSHPDDYGSVAATLLNAERLLLLEEEEEEADALYRLAYQKGVVLAHEASLYRARLNEEARQLEILRQAIQAEEARQKREAEELKQQQARAALKRKSLGGRVPANNNDDRHNLPVSHTVRRGETLPQVAARNEIYNDAALWPIIYRANRDQVRDPYQLWPGQVLKIPRGFSREDAIEARKQAARRGL